MKIFICRDNAYVSLINNRVTYIFDKKNATNFGDMDVNSFIRMKKELKKREGVEFELEFA